MNVAAAAAAATAPAAPAAPAASEVVERKKKVNHPTVEAGEKFEAIPTDFDPKEHKALRVVDFKDEVVWWDYRITVIERQLEDAKKTREEVKAMGSAKDRARAKKLIKYKTQMDELLESLKEDGMTDEQIEALMKGQAG